SLRKSNQDFHKMIIDHARSVLLSRTMSRVLAQMRLAFSPFDVALHLEFREKHFTIIYLLRRGEIEAAAQVLERYLKDSEEHSDLIVDASNDGAVAAPELYVAPNS